MTGCGWESNRREKLDPAVTRSAAASGPDLITFRSYPPENMPGWPVRMTTAPTAAARPLPFLRPLLSRPRRHYTHSDFPPLQTISLLLHLAVLSFPTAFNHQHPPNHPRAPSPQPPHRPLSCTKIKHRPAKSSDIPN